MLFLENVPAIKNQNHDYDELMDYGPVVIDSLERSMTLSRNKEFNWKEFVLVRPSFKLWLSTSLPNCTSKRWELDFVRTWFKSVILVGLPRKSEWLSPLGSTVLKRSTRLKVDQSKAFFRVVPTSLKRLLDRCKNRIAYGGYSLGGSCCL